MAWNWSSKHSALVRSFVWGRQFLFSGYPNHCESFKSWGSQNFPSLVHTHSSVVKSFLLQFYCWIRFWRAACMSFSSWSAKAIQPGKHSVVRNWKTWGRSKMTVIYKQNMTKTEPPMGRIICTRPLPFLLHFHLCNSYSELLYWGVSWKATMGCRGEVLFRGWIWLEELMFLV